MSETTAYASEQLVSGGEAAPRMPGANHGQRTTQYITFSVGNEVFGVDIVTVREIKGWTDTTALPNAPAFMRGVLNLRGTIVPIYDLRARLGLGTTAASKNHVIVIVTVSDRIIGILVDAVSDILSIRETEIRPVPETGAAVEQLFLSGLVTVEQRMATLLDLAQLFDLHVVAETCGQ